MVALHIGVDDTDSKHGMCTTYVGAVIADELRSRDFKLKGFPRLIRLNPNIPWKTRGNCAVALTVELEESRVPEVKKLVLNAVKNLAELHVKTTNPGVAFLLQEEIPSELAEFSRRTVQEVVTLEDAEKLAREVGAEVHGFKLGRGIIGALAAVGAIPHEHWTYELLAYRTPEHRGKPRKLDGDSVKRMDELTYPDTFDNLDPFTGELRITPHTPCPILYGIRASHPRVLERARQMVKALEPVERWTIYLTNQGTDEHLKRVKVKEVKPYLSVVVEGRVSERPRIIPGGHVILKVEDGTGEICCAAYEPTRGFRRAVEQLAVGDEVEVCGGVKPKPELPLTINLEKFSIRKLAPKLKRVNPTCPSCGRRMRSRGRGRGYECERCKTWAPPAASGLIEIPRLIKPSSFEVPPRARRHLAKPLLLSRARGRVY